MATIKKREGKNGVSYKITVTQGRDLEGKQVRHYRTWAPDPGMTDRQMEKAVQKAAVDFEREIELGYQMDNRQTFAQYAEYVLELKERAGCKHRTLERYQELMKRIVPSIGHIKLADLRPQHLNNFYKALSAPGIAMRGDKATAKTDLKKYLQEIKMTKAQLAALSGVSAVSITAACQGKKMARTTAEAIAQALDEKVDILFSIESSAATLSSKTILEHHRLIRTILAQAEKEMLVPYNAAAKATPPKPAKQEVNYFQIDDIVRIREALEQEPLKWQVITHLLIVTGCRRGEIMGLKWDKIDFKSGRVRIDTALLYAPERGIYEDTTKTGNVRFLNLPAETMALLREYRRWYLEQRLKNGDRWKDAGFVFVRDDGRPMNPDSIWSWLQKFSKRHGLPHINPHAFRHTVASILIANGTDVVTVSKQLGHINVGTTEDFYSHIIEESKAKASECIADVLLRRKA